MDPENNVLIVGQKIKKLVKKMRDPKRIPKILTELDLLWRKYPDQRLGQLLENYVFPNILVKKVDVLGKLEPNTPTLKVAWMFFQEDDETLKKLRELNKNEKNQK